MHIYTPYVPRLRRIITTSLAVVVVAATLTISTSKPTAAACAAPATSYGSASMQLTVSTAGSYRIWTRMNVPNTTNNSYFLEIDGGTCVVVGDSDIPANSWTWVNHQNGTLSSKITTTLSAGTHTIKVIGREPDVKLDRILAVSDQNCTPAGLGDNCMATADTVKPTVSIIDPPKNDNVNGTVAIKATASDNTAVSKVEFYIQNKLVATDTTTPYEYNWDTTSLANGTYAIDAKAYDPIGNIGIDTIAVGVKNGDVTAPKAPGTLTGTAASGVVDLTWKASTDNVGVTAYRVVRDNQVIATLAGNATSYHDTSVVVDTKYAYYIVAVDASNNTSAPSNTATVVTPKPTTVDTQAPSIPADMNAQAVSTSQINVSWKASTDNVGVKNYDLYRLEGASTNTTKVATLTTTSYGDGGLKAGTAYTYYVIARDAAGNTSQASNKVSATTTEQANDHTGKSTLRGIVQSNSGRPLANVKVTMWVKNKRYQATTNYSGRYIMTNIPSGRYEVNYQLSGYSRKTITIKLNADKTKWQDMTLRRR